MKWGTGGAVAGVVIGLLITLSLYLFPSTDGSPASILTSPVSHRPPVQDQQPGTYAYAPPAPSYSGAYDLGETSDPRINSLSSMAAYYFTSGNDSEANKILNLSNDSEDRDRVLEATVNRMSMDDFSEVASGVFVPGEGEDGANNSEGSLGPPTNDKSKDVLPLYLDPTSSGAQVAPDPNPENPIFTPPGLKNGFSGFGSGEQAADTKPQEARYKRLIQVARMIHDPLIRSQALVGIFPFRIDYPAPIQKLREEVLKDAVSALEEYKRTQAVSHIPLGAIWAFSWPVFLGLVGFIVAEFSKPIIDAYGKAVGAAMIKDFKPDEFLEAVRKHLRAEGTEAAAGDMDIKITPAIQSGLSQVPLVGGAADTETKVVADLQDGPDGPTSGDAETEPPTVIACDAQNAVGQVENGDIANIDT